MDVNQFPELQVRLREILAAARKAEAQRIGNALLDKRDATRARRAQRQRENRAARHEPMQWTRAEDGTPAEVGYGE